MPWKCIQNCKPHLSFHDWLLVMCLQCACNIPKVMYLIIILLSQITKYINQKLTGAGAYGIWEKHKLLGSHLCLACLSVRRSHRVLLTSELGSCEFRQTFWDAAVPALSTCHLQVIRAAFLAPPRDIDYCCLLYCSALLWVQHVMYRGVGLELLFPLNWFNFLKFNQDMIGILHVFYVYIKYLLIHALFISEYLW